jgi:hypothetical protein
MDLAWQVRVNAHEQQVKFADLGIIQGIAALGRGSREISRNNNFGA